MTASAFPSATQTTQEAGTTSGSFVSPLRQQFHQSAAKAWAQAGVAGNITNSFNIAGVVDVGTGVIEFAFIVPMSAANYAVVATPIYVPPITAATTLALWVAFDASYTVSTFRVGCVRVSDYANTDPTYWNVVVYGDE